MNLLDFYLPEEALVALSLLVLLFVLTRVFWKPLIKVIDDRRNSVEDMLKQAEEAKKAIAEMDERRLRHDAELERQTALKIKEARELASREYDRIVALAEEKARRFAEAGQEKARHAFEQSMSESREAIISLALGAASIVAQMSMDSEKNRKFIEATLEKELGAKS